MFPQLSKHGLTARRSCDMDAGLAVVFAAVVAALGGIAVAIIQMRNLAKKTEPTTQSSKSDSTP